MIDPLLPLLLPDDSLEAFDEEEIPTVNLLRESELRPVAVVPRRLARPERPRRERTGTPNLLLVALVQALPGPEPVEYGEPDPDLEPWISASRLLDVNTLADQLIEERAEQATDESYAWGDPPYDATLSFNRLPKGAPTDGPWMGRPADSGAGRFAWDAAARFVMALERANLAPALRMRCGNSPGNAVLYDKKTKSAMVSIEPSDEARARELVKGALRGGLGQVRATFERAPMGVSVTFSAAGDRVGEEEAAAFGKGARHRDPRLTEVYKIEAELALAIPTEVSAFDRVAILRRRGEIASRRAQLLADLQANPPVERAPIPLHSYDSDDDGIS
jgi:hypothetical protein